MKATIRKSDGTVIEAEGTPEEIAAAAGQSPTMRIEYVYLPAQPCTLPHYPPVYPQWPYQQQPTVLPWVIGGTNITACAGNANGANLLFNR